MARRTAPQSKTDDQAFPIRVKIARPPEGLWLAYGEIRAWLTSEMDEGRHAWHSAHWVRGDAVAVYFRSLEDARRFLEAFPALELADGTALGVYRSPAVPFGRP